MNNNEETTLYMVRGDTKYLTIETDGDDITLTGAWFTVKANKTDTNFLFQKYLNNGITQSGTTYTVRVDQTDTNSLSAGNYFYDLQIEANNDTFTILRGILTIFQDITLPANETE